MSSTLRIHGLRRRAPDGDVCLDPVALSAAALVASFA
jgi:hypothetical protein